VRAQAAIAGYVLLVLFVAILSAVLAGAFMLALIF